MQPFGNIQERLPEKAVIGDNDLALWMTDLVQRNGWPVTFSMGVVTFERMPASVDEMLNIADAQMYSAKQNGKNRTWFKVFDKNDFVTGSLLNAYYP